MGKTHFRPILNGEVPQYAYPLAILSGGGAYVIAQLAAPRTAWLTYALIAALFGSVWPNRPWQWGCWLCLPVASLIFLDLAITGNIVVVVLGNGTMLAKALAVSCLGAYAGSKLPLRHLANRTAHRKRLKGNRNGAQNKVVSKKLVAPHQGVKTISSSHSVHNSAQSPDPASRLKAANAALMDAVREGNLDGIKLLVTEGAEVNARGNGQWTPLVPGAQDFDAEMARAMFGKGASADASGGQGWTPLMIAAIEGHAEVVSALLEHGAQVNAENYEGWTALRFAVSMDETEILRLLLNAGADANVTDHEGQTALMQAARENSRESLKALLDAGADPLIEDQNQQTALRIAQEHGHTEIAGPLKEAEARVSHKAETPVHNVWLSPARLLIIAAIFHLTLTLTIFLSGRYGLFPNAFDNNGVGISFAADGLEYRARGAELSELLKHGEILNWLTSGYPVHVRLYSISFALLGPWLGANIISAEPLNVLYYLAILALVFRIGEEAFSRRVGLLAAVMVALWPSLLLHTTQLLRDPLFVAGMLALILIILRLACTRAYSWTGALLAVGLGSLTSAVLWLVRGNMGEIVVAALFVGTLILIVRQFRRKRPPIANLCGMALLIVMTIISQKVLPRYGVPGYVPPFATKATTPGTLTAGAVRESVRSPAAVASSPSIWSRMAAPVLSARRGFILRYPNAGSNIDSDVRLTGMGDLIRYLPRAAAIGFFAPFPEMWFISGKQVGATGRLLAGAESFLVYLVEAFALYGLWRGRRRLSAWFLFLVAATGMIALGLVVTNIAALFRMRLVFLILIIMLAAEGAASIFGRFSKKLVVAAEP